MSNKTRRLYSVRAMDLDYTFPDGFSVKVPAEGPSAEIPAERAVYAAKAAPQLVGLYDEPKAVEAPVVESEVPEASAAEDPAVPSTEPEVPAAEAATEQAPAEPEAQAPGRKRR